MLSFTIVFSSAIILQFLTFADLSNLFFYNENSKINISCFLMALVFFFTYFTSYAIISIFLISGPTLISNDYSDYINHLFSNNDIAYVEIIKSILIPIVLYLFLVKILFYFFFYSKNLGNLREKEDSFDFSVKNIFRNIKSAVLKDKSLAYIYLFRIYNLFITLLFSMLIFYFLNSNLFVFSDKNIKTFLIYNSEKKSDIKLQYFLNIQIVSLVYLFMQIIHFFNYPRFQKTKQIFDSIFVLYDLRLMNSLEIEKTCEKQVLESAFIVDFLNFDSQSELFYNCVNATELLTKNLSEVHILIHFLNFSFKNF